jgi:hypothetical protein
MLVTSAGMKPADLELPALTHGASSSPPVNGGALEHPAGEVVDTPAKVNYTLPLSPEFSPVLLEIFAAQDSANTERGNFK